MKPPLPDQDQNQPTTTGPSTVIKKKSLFRSLIPGKSSSSQSKKKEALAAPKTSSKLKSASEMTVVNPSLSRTSAQPPEIRVRPPDKGRQQFVEVVDQNLPQGQGRTPEMLDHLNVPQKSSRISKPKTPTKKSFSPQLFPQPGMSSPHSILPSDHLNSSRSPRITKKRREPSLRRDEDVSKPSKGSRDRVKKNSENVQIHDRPSSQQLPKRNGVKETVSKSNVARRPSNPKSPPGKTAIRPKKSTLSIDSSTKRKNRQLIQQVADLRKNCDHYRKEIKRVKDEQFENVVELQRENESLNMELCNLNRAVEGWKSRCQRQENENTALVKVKNLTKMTKELTEDIDVLKSVIHRLNNEISFYQEKLGIQYDYSPNKVPAYSTSSSSGTKESDEAGYLSEDILKEPTKKLFPLLVAYDEVIKDKNEIIKSHEDALDRFKKQCQAVVQENQNLHELICDQKEKGTVSIEEWQFLHSNSIIVLEENDLLHEQISILKQKDEIMIKNHEQKTSKLTTKISLLEEEKLKLKSAAIETEKNCKMLMDQHSKFADIIEKRIPLEQHEASVFECKQLFETLKINYDDERTVLLERLSSAEKERDRLVLELAELEAENGRMQSNMKTCEDALAVNAVRFREVYSRMLEATEARDSTTVAMEDMMALSQRVVSERENTEALLREQRSLNEKLITLRDRECELISELHSKIKAMEDVHQRELENLVRRIKELERIINGIGDGHKQEILRLEELVHEKVKRIEHLEVEKKQLQLDLETVWKTTTGSINDLKLNSSQVYQEK